MKITKFTSSKEPFGWMGNMCGVWNGEPLNILYDGKIYPCSENLFQSLRFSDLAIQEEIRNTNGYNSKQIAKKYSDKMTVKRLSKEDVENMFFVVSLKLEQHPMLVEELIKLDVDSFIVEDVSARLGGSGLFWGCAQIENSEYWVGHNVLGRIYECFLSLYKNDLLIEQNTKYIEYCIIDIMEKINLTLI